MGKWTILLTAVAILHSQSVRVGRSDDWFNPNLNANGQLDRFELFDWQRVLRAQDEESIYDEPLATDRPDFTEASSVVGRGILQIEMGYTYFHDDEAGTRVRSHTAPETLFRYGLSDNVELRLVWNYLWTDTTTAGITEREDGAEDLIMGFKFALTSQSGWVPESALILDMSSPTGGAGITTELAEFGSNYLFGWDLADDKSVAGSFGYSTGHELSATGVPPLIVSDRHGVFHASATHGFPLSESWNAYVEYFGLYFHGLDGGRPQNYIDSGITYLFNNNAQFDARIGVGLNPSADDFFAGTGLSFRF